MEQELVIAKISSFFSLCPTSIHWIIHIEHFKDGKIKLYRHKVCSVADALSYCRNILENEFGDEEKYYIIKRYMIPNRNLHFLHDGD